MTAFPEPIRSRPLAVPDLPRMAPGMRGFVVDPSIFEAVGNVPTINARGFVLQAGAMGAVGEGMQQTGSALEKIADYAAEVRTRNDVLEADEAMVEFQKDIAIEITNQPNETEWLTIADKGTAKAEDTWTKKGLSPNALLTVREKFSRWRGKVMFDTALAAATRSRDKYGANLNAQRIRLANAEDYAGADAKADEMVREGVLAEDKAEIYKADNQRLGKQAAEGSLYKSHYDAVLDNPEGWLKANQKPHEGMDPVMHRNLANLAEEQSRQQVATVAGGLSDAIAGGQIRTEADLEKAAAGKLSPSGLARAKAQFFRMQDARVKAYNASPEGLIRNTGWADSMVDDFDPSAANARDTRILLENEIKNRLPSGATRDDLLKRLEQKWNPGTTPPRADLKTWGSTQLSNWYADGKFGNFKELVLKEPGDAGYYEGTIEQKWKVVPDKRNKAWDKRGQVAQAWTDWLGKNGQATIEEGRVALDGIAAKLLNPEDVDGMIGPPPGLAAEEKAPAFRLKKYEPPALPQKTPPQSEGNDAGTDLPDGGEELPGLLPTDLLPPPTPEEYRAEFEAEEE